MDERDRSAMEELLAPTPDCTEGAGALPKLGALAGASPAASHQGFIFVFWWFAAGRFLMFLGLLGFCGGFH